MDPKISPVTEMGDLTFLDFPGVPSVVFYTSGCNMSCGFCHNRVLMTKQPRMTWAELDEALREGTFQTWADGAVISGGEPLCDLTSDIEELIDRIRGHKERIRVKVFTNGSRPVRVVSVLDKLGEIDAVSMDFKGTAEFYRDICKFWDFENILRSMELIREGDVPYEFRITVLERYHTKEMLEAMLEFLTPEDKVYLQAFQPRDTMPEEFRDLPATSKAYISELREHAKQLGYKRIFEAF